MRMLRPALAMTLLLASVAACTADSDPTANDPKAGPPRGATPVVQRGAAQLAAARPTLPTSAALALERGQWAGDLHHAIMADLIANKATWVGRVPTRETKCRGLVRLVAKYAPQVYTHVGWTRTPAEIQQAVEEAVAHTELCRGTTMSLVLLRTSRVVPHVALAASVASNEEEVTGEFLAYNDAMTGTTNVSDGGTPADVANNVSGVMASASAIPAADLEVVGATGSLSVSSADEWYSYYSGGGGGGGGENMMSLFRRRMVPIWAIVAGVDVLGCVGGAASAYIGGEKRKGHLAAQCVVWGAVGSGSGYLAM